VAAAVCSAGWRHCRCCPCRTCAETITRPCGVEDLLVPVIEGVVATQTSTGARSGWSLWVINNFSVQDHLGVGNTRWD